MARKSLIKVKPKKYKNGDYTTPDCQDNFL